MKRILSLILALMVIFALSACGGGNQPAASSNSTAETSSSSESGFTKEQRAKELITVATGPTSGIYYPIGGAFATAVYAAMQQPVAVEHVRASAGLDSGGTLIGMHLREVAVPVRLQTKQIGQAMPLAARARPKFFGGIRAVYDCNLL